MRGDCTKTLVLPKSRRETNHPSPSIPLPVKGRGRPEISRSLLIARLPYNAPRIKHLARARVEKDFAFLDANPTNYDQRASDESQAKKEEDAVKLALQKQERCDEARGYVKSLESGIRISRTDANGERTFLDDDQRAKELERTQKIMADACK